MEEKRFKKSCLSFIKNLRTNLKIIQTQEDNELLYFNQKNNILSDKEFSKLEYSTIKPYRVDLVINQKQLDEYYNDNYNNQDVSNNSDSMNTNQQVIALNQEINEEKENSCDETNILIHNTGM